MPSISRTCGNSVQSLRTVMGVTCDRLSTFRRTTQHVRPTRRGKGLVFPVFTRRSYTDLSTIIHSSPPLEMAGFYPLSTPPITITTKNKRKEY